MNKICILLFFILLTGCNENYQKELNKVRSSGYLINEDTSNNLLGIDKNNNNIRDDIENYIQLKYKNNPEYMNALLDLSVDLNRQFKSITNDKEDYYQMVQKVSDDFECIRKIEKRLGINYEDRAYIDIVALYSNTPLRQNHTKNIDKLLDGYTFKSSKCN